MAYSCQRILELEQVHLAMEHECDVDETFFGEGPIVPHNPQRQDATLENLHWAEWRKIVRQQMQFLQKCLEQKDVGTFLRAYALLPEELRPEE